MAFTRTAVGFIALGTALAVAPAATAEEEPRTRLVLEDPTGDVWRAAGGDGTTQVDDMPSADVVSASVMHGRRSFEVTSTFADLQQVDHQTYAVELMTPGHVWWSFNVSAGPGNWDGTLHVWGGGEDEGRVRCPDAVHTIDYEADTVSLVVPRSCVDRPEWARASITNWLDQGAPEPNSTMFWDNPHSSGAEADTTRRLWRAPAPESTEPTATYRADLTDPTGDVWTSEPEFVPAPDMPGADIERTAIDHRPHRLVLRMAFTDLQLGGRQTYESWILSKGEEHYLRLNVSPRHPKGVTRLGGTSLGKERCTGLRHDVDRESDRVTISVPRRCLGRPAWVRLHIIALFVSEAGSTPERIYHLDNPHNDRVFPDGLTPRIHVADS